MKKFQNKFFLVIYPGTKSPFLNPKNVPNFFGYTSYYHRKKTQVVTGTKYGSTSKLSFF
jgi:hypothetical protein